MEVSSGEVRGQIPKGNRERQETSELVTEETGRWGKKERKVKLKDLRRMGKVSQAGGDGGKENRYILRNIYIVRMLNFQTQCMTEKWALIQDS